VEVIVVDVLEVSNVVKRYSREPVVKDFSLELGAGCLHGLLGPNGSGKTTTLHIIAGLLRPDGGTVTISGESILSKSSRRHFGFAPDDLPLPKSLTAREYLRFHDAMRGRDDRRRAETLIQAMDLGSAVDKTIDQYSHGMKRKLQVVAALAHEPELLILDEPFRGLDPEASAILLELLHRFTESGRSVLLATHDMLRAQRDCQDVTILSDGVVVGRGNPDDLVVQTPESSSLEDVFMQVTGRRDVKLARQASLDGVFAALS
jgi:ABC-2 type transport system ATP-binding protein